MKVTYYRPYCLDATPYLRKKYDYFKSCDTIVDIGSGNGRNTSFLRTHAHEVVPLDIEACTAVCDAVICDVGSDRFPIADSWADGILANYVFMFLSKSERRHVISEIQRITTVGSVLMYELHPAKTSYFSFGIDSLDRDLYENMCSLGWEGLTGVKGKAVMKRVA